MSAFHLYGFSARPHTVKCAVCGKSFTTVSRNRKYCDDPQCRALVDLKRALVAGRVYRARRAFDAAKSIQPCASTQQENGREAGKEKQDAQDQGHSS